MLQRCLQQASSQAHPLVLGVYCDIAYRRLFQYQGVGEVTANLIIYQHHQQLRLRSLDAATGGGKVCLTFPAAIGQGIYAGHVLHIRRTGLPDHVYCLWGHFNPFAGST
jgi:hypothetical protein